MALDIRDGETLAIIGRSGSGNSVLLKNIIGMMRPDGGSVIVDGADLHRISYAELLSFVRTMQPLRATSA